MRKKRLYIGVTIAVKVSLSGKVTSAYRGGTTTIDVSTTGKNAKASIDASGVTHLVLATSTQDAERQAKKEAQNRFGTGYSLRTTMEPLADMVWRLKHEEDFDGSDRLLALLREGETNETRVAQRKRSWFFFARRKADSDDS